VSVTKNSLACYQQKETNKQTPKLYMLFYRQYDFGFFAKEINSIDV